MKVSFMTFACPEWSFDQVVSAAAQYGYHGVEFRIDAQHAHGIEVYTSKDEREAFRQKLDKAGIEVPCLATSLQFTHDEVYDQAIPRIDLAAEIGAPALRVFCGPAVEFAELDVTIDRVARQLQEVAVLASEQQVDLWLETHDTFCQARHAAAAVEQANHEAIGINYDNMHPYRKGETIEETFAALGTLTRHCHFHDAMNLADKVIVKPIGQGELPVDEMFDHLIKSGYDGYLSGEWFHQQYGETPEESIERYRNDIGQLCERHGVKLMML